MSPSPPAAAPDRTAVYLLAADLALSVLSEPAVSRSWDESSALAGFCVSGLAGHLAGQLTSVELTLDHPVTHPGPVPLLEHYARVPWVGADLDDERMVAIRAGGEQAAADGYEPLLARTRAARTRLGLRLTGLPLRTVVQPPWTSWSLRLDDFLATRLMEIAVHSDDLAVSVGVETPTLPASVADPVFDLLTRLAVRRHGQPAVLRAFSRAERAPVSVAAF